MLKRIGKLFISLVICAIDRLSEAVLGKTAARRTIIYYHSVPARDLAAFTQQMGEISKNFRPLSLDIATTLPVEGKEVVLTFDDGFSASMDNVVPILKSLSIPFAVFVPVGLLGLKPAWSEGVRSANECVISAGELRSLAKSSLVTIGSHCITHPNLCEVDEGAAMEEILGSISMLEEVLVAPVTFLSFPFGAYNEAHVRFARLGGYMRVFSSEPVCVHPAQYVLGRVAVSPTDWPLEFRLKILGCYRWLAIVPNAKKALRHVFNKCSKH